jgi:ADP-ribose pyrophosphatase
VARHVVEFPAGLIGDTLPLKARRESITIAARRELLEETGYRARTMRFLTAGPAAAGSSTVVITFFLASGLTKAGDGGGDESENISIHEVPLAKADAWLESMRGRGYWVDPKVYAGLYFLKNYNKDHKFSRKGIKK